MYKGLWVNDVGSVVGVWVLVVVIDPFWYNWRQKGVKWDSVVGMDQYIGGVSDKWRVVRIKR